MATSDEGLATSVNKMLAKVFPGLFPENLMPLWEEFICLNIFFTFLACNINSILQNLRNIFKRLLRNYAYTFGVATLMTVASYVLLAKPP